MAAWERGSTMPTRAPKCETRLAELDAEWKATDRRIAEVNDPDKIGELLGRIDELEFEIDELVRSKRPDG